MHNCRFLHGYYMQCTDCLHKEVSVMSMLQSSHTFSLSLSLRFNARFPGEPGLANSTEAKDGGSGGDNWTYKSYVTKLQSNRHHQQSNTQPFTDQIPYLSYNQQCQSTEGKMVACINNINHVGKHGGLIMTHSYLPRYPQ